MKINPLLFIVSALFTTGIKGQTDKGNFLNNRLRLETPIEASFNKFIENPINLYNGTPNVDVSIYTLRDRDVEIPINIRYNTSGIKVDEEAGWIGLGWNLNISGLITRQVIGGVDQYTTTNGIDRHRAVMDILDINTFQNDDYMEGKPWPEALRNAFEEEFQRNVPPNGFYEEGRFSPDVFYFSGPGFSGKFIIDFYNGKINVLDRTDNIRIETILGDDAGYLFNSQGSRLKGFKITTVDGIIHQFDLFSSMGSTARYSTSSETYVLSRSVYPNGQVITYHYDKITSIKYSFNHTIKSIVPGTLTALPYDGSIGSQFLIDQLNLTESSLLPVGLEYANQYAGNDPVISKIETSNYNIYFHSSERQDLPYEKKLDRIVICLKNETPVKEWDFQYLYSESDPENNYWSKANPGYVNNVFRPEHFAKRLNLVSVSQVNNGRTSEKYSFYYNERKLPRKDSYAVDYWGCYNGVHSNTSFIPALDNLLYRDYYGDFSFTLRKIMDKCEENLLFKRANRAYDFESCKAGILTGIGYPLGGYTEFIYEPNSFTDDFIPTVQEVNAGPTVNKIAIYDDNSFFAPSDLYPSARNAFFSVQEETDVSVVIALRRGNYTWADLAEHRAYIDLGRTKIDLSEELRNNCYSQHINETNYGGARVNELSITKKIRLPSTSGYFVVDLPDRFGVQQGGQALIQLGAEYIKKSPPGEKAESKGAGLRIKEINFYESKEKIKRLKYTHYRYTEPESGRGSGILQEKLRFYNYYDDMFDVAGKMENSIPSIGNTCLAPWVRNGGLKNDKIEITKDNCISDPYRNAPNVGYTYVTEISKSENDSLGHVLYSFYNESPKIHPSAIKLTSPLNGKISEIQYYDSSMNLLKTEKMSYVKMIADFSCGITYWDKLNFSPELYDHFGFFALQKYPYTVYEYCVNANGRVLLQPKFNHNSFEGNHMMYNRYKLVQFPVNSYFVYLKSKEILADGVVTTEDYTYDSKFQLKEKKTQSSSSKELKTIYMYPYDFDCPVYQTMTDRNMISAVIEEKNYRHGDYIEGRLREYYYNDNAQAILPKTVWFSEIDRHTNSSTFDCSGANGDIFPIKNIHCESYDNYGNIREVLKNETLRETFLWGYNGQYPVAKIVNAPYLEVLSILGQTTINLLNSATVSDEYINNTISMLRSHPSMYKAQVYTYTYRPPTGMASMTDPRGITEYYEYDDFHRLKKVMDFESNILKNYDYHYRP